MQCAVSVKFDFKTIMLFGNDAADTGIPWFQARTVLLFDSIDDAGARGWTGRGGYCSSVPPGAAGTRARAGPRLPGSAAAQAAEEAEGCVA